MLDPGYFDDKDERIQEIFRKLEEFILRDISRRILSAGELTATADRLLYKLQQSVESREAIERKLAQIMGMAQKELRKVLQGAVIASWESDKVVMEQMGITDIVPPLRDPNIRAVMDAEYKKSLGELKNLTRTTMDQVHSDLINMLDDAEIRVSSGVQSYSQAACDILDQYAGRGVVVYYPRGVKRSLEGAVRTCVVTSMNQTAGQVSNQYIKESGSEYVLVSAHPGARVKRKGQPNLAGHDLWQGKAYKIRGSEPGFPNLLESTGYDIDPETGIGTVVNPLGLHGYNCRHSHQMWDKDLVNPWVDENGNPIIDLEESRKRYKLQQEQRGMERAIRKTKRRLVTKKAELDMVTDPDIKKRLEADYEALAGRWTKQNGAYNDFCAKNDLRPQYDRIKTAGFDRKQTASANAAAKRYLNEQRKMETV